MNFDAAFLQSARLRLAAVDQRIRTAKTHAHWHPQNEWQAFTGEPKEAAPARLGIASALRRISELCTRPAD